LLAQITIIVIDSDQSNVKKSHTELQSRGVEYSPHAAGLKLGTQITSNLTDFSYQEAIAHTVAYNFVTLLVQTV